MDSFDRFLRDYIGLTIRQLYLFNEDETTVQELFNNWIRLEKPTNLQIAIARDTLKDFGYDIEES